MHICGAFRSNEENLLVLFALYLTYYNVDFRQAECRMDSSGQCALVARIQAAEIQL